MPRTVMLETEWVLRGIYELPPAGVIAALRAFAGLPGVVIEDADSVARTSSPLASASSARDPS